jgi:hypothetical protein
MAEQLFREKSLKYISSPDELNDYLKVAKPSVWVILLSIVILLVGLLIWGSFTYIGSSIDGIAEVEDGMLIMTFYSQEYAANVNDEMNVRVGDTECPITSVGKDEYGQVFVIADTRLENGIYEASVTYKETQVLGLLFGN